MRKICVSFTLVLIFLFHGCAGVPKESVELSVTLGRDLAEVHRSHRQLAIQYFVQIKNNIDKFVDEVYRPYIIRKTIKDFQLIERIQKTTRANAKQDPLTVMEVFVTLEEIESYRQELSRPIEKKEQELLIAIDDSYQKLQNANAIVTGHLASVRRVHDAQAELLERSNLEDLRREFIDEAVVLSDQITDLVEKGRKAGHNVQEIQRAVKELKDLVSELD
jgi:hypothetical protein